MKNWTGTMYASALMIFMGVLGVVLTFFPRFQNHSINPPVIIFVGGMLMMRMAIDQRTIEKLKAELEQLKGKGLGNG